MAAGMRGRSNSYGRNLSLLKGINPAADDEDDLERELNSPAEQNKWLFEVAWEVANKGRYSNNTPSMLKCDHIMG